MDIDGKGEIEGIEIEGEVIRGWSTWRYKNNASPSSTHMHQ
jgi:hypothetical protein